MLIQNAHYFITVLCLTPDILLMNELTENIRRMKSMEQTIDEEQTKLPAHYYISIELTGRLNKFNTYSISPHFLYIDNNIYFLRKC